MQFSDLSFQLLDPARFLASGGSLGSSLDSKMSLAQENGIDFVHAKR